MPDTIRTLLVDDEPGCIDNLRYYLTVYCPRIRVVGTCSDPDEAMALLRNTPADLAFLDVQLFDRNIFDLLQGENTGDLSFVFVTAYEQYALKAIRISALDYLLKPLESSEVIRCYEKILRNFDAPAQTPVLPEAARTEKILLRNGDHIYPIAPENILFLKAHGFYTDVCFEFDHRIRNIVVSKPINTVCKEWQSPELLRVHRSFVVNLGKVQGVRRTGTGIFLEMPDSSLVPVAKRRMTDFYAHYHE